MEIYSILFNRLLSETAKRQASDLHLSVGSVPVLKKDGRLVRMDGEKIEGGGEGQLPVIVKKGKVRIKGS